MAIAEMSCFRWPSEGTNTVVVIDRMKAVLCRFTELAKQQAGLLARSFSDDLCIVEYRAVMALFLEMLIIHNE